MYEEIFNISNAGRASWYDFAREILANMKMAEEVTVEPITAAELGRPAPRPRFSVLDNRKFYKKTGYIMRPWEDALRNYINDECLS